LGFGIDFQSRLDAFSIKLDGISNNPKSKIRNPKSKGMLLYGLICLSLSLAGVAGLQFFYMAYLERLDRTRKRRIHELEQHCKYLTNRLKDAESQINEQNDLIEAIYDELETEDEEEVWADVIEDR
jgi:hypothetical protein